MTEPRASGPKVQEAGFTLIEVMIVIVFVAVVIGGIAAAMITSFKNVAAVQSKVSDSHDAQVAASYFARDVQTATTLSTAATPTCGGGGAGTQVLGLGWTDSSSGNQVNVSYKTATLGGVAVLQRWFCNGAGSPSPTVISHTGSISVDQTVKTDGVSTVSTAPFSTNSPNELLVAYVSADGPKGPKQTVTVSGAGLAWTRAVGTNGANGDAEIWTASTSSVLKGAIVTATEGISGHDESLVVVAYDGAGGVGATNASSSAAGAPSVTLVPKMTGSVIAGVGQDWNASIARTLGANQTLVYQMPDPAHNDTRWVQSVDGTQTMGIPTVVDDTAPTNDSYDLAAIEITPRQASSAASLTCNQYFPTCSQDATATKGVSVLEVASLGMNVTEASGFTFSVNAVPRLSLLASAGTTGASLPPLTLLGSGGADCSSGGSLTVYGAATVNSASPGSFKFQSGTLTASQVYSTGASLPVSPPSAFTPYGPPIANRYPVGPPIADPFQNLPVPKSQLPGVPTFISGPGGSGPIVPTDGSSRLSSGVYVFTSPVIDGLRSDSGGVVLVDLASGTISVGGSSDLDIYPITGVAGFPYDGIALFAPNATAISLVGNGQVTALNGIIVAPGAGATLPGNAEVDALGLIASGISGCGTGDGVFGPKPIVSSSSVTSSLNPSHIGDAVTFTATVVPTGGDPPTGTVTFTATGSASDTTTLCSNVQVTNGQAPCTTNALVPSDSPYQITASYISDTGADQNWSGSMTHYVSYVTTTTLTGLGPLVSGQTAVYSATVTAPGPTPAGAVTFVATPSSGSPITLCAGVALSGGQAQCQTSALMASRSPYTVTTSFTPSDPNKFSPSSSGPQSQSVTVANTSTALNSSANPSVPGETVTFDASVSVTAPGSGTPAGSVTFMDGTAPIACANGSAPFNGTNATCVVTYATLAGSPHPITAVYGGDGNFAASTSPVLSQSVLTATRTVVTSSANPQDSQVNVTFTATVSPSGSGTPAGSVTFTATSTNSTNPVTLCANVLLSGGAATCSTAALSAGGSPYTITAAFADTDGHFRGSSGTLSQTIRP
jgi:type II secretory pathway pseudopilin PulG